MDTFREHLVKEHEQPYVGRRSRIRLVILVAASSEANRNVSQNTDRAMVAFQKWRLQFCEEWVARMPAELRDMTYDHILEPDCALVISHYVEYEDLPAENRLSAPDAYQIAELFKAEIVGQPFADDISRSLCSRESVIVGRPSYLECAIPSSFIPPRLRIHWWADDDCKYTLAYCSRLLLDGEIQGTTTIELYLHMRAPSCAVLLNRLAPTMFKLKEKGVGIIITRPLLRNCLGHYGDGRYLKVYYESNRPRLAHDLTWLFAGDMMDFKKNIMFNGKKLQTLVSFQLSPRDFYTDFSERPSWASGTR
jgi:hypothetical protein